MATYKVIQDIEAEDKFLGPLTLKQFIFGAAAVFFGYSGFFAVVKGMPALLIIFAPPAFLGLFLAIPWSSQQSTEVWALAKLRFHLKPRARIWNQSGLEELVRITAPKKIDKQLTNGLDETEVRSRLKALAETIDSRGWAVKNAIEQQAYMPSYRPEAGERLVDLAALPQTVPDADPNQYKDVLDEDEAVSAKFQRMMRESSQTRVQESLAKMDRVRHGEPLESVQRPEVHFTPPADLQPTPMPAPSVLTPSGTSPVFTQVAPPAPNEQVLSQQLRNKRNAGDLAYNRLHTVPAAPHASSFGQPQLPIVQPAFSTSTGTDDSTQSTDDAQTQAGMTNTPDPAILNLAQNNDLNVETIARQAKKDDPKENEVVISLR